MIAGLLLSSIGVGALITRFGQWKPYLIVGSVMLIAGSYLLSTIHYDTNFALVSLYMFLLGAGVGMTMQNFVLVVQNTSKPTEIGVASSGVTFFRSLGGTIGVSLMGAALAASVTDLLADAKDAMAAIVSLGAQGAEVADHCRAGTLPQASTMPEVVRRDLRRHLRAGHLALVPDRGAVRHHQPDRGHLHPRTKPLTKMTTSERIQASEADLATVSVPGGMDVLAPTEHPSARIVADGDGQAETDASAGASATANVDRMAELESSEARTHAVRALEASSAKSSSPSSRRLLAENAHRV